jgi:hypothetical protein
VSCYEKICEYAQFRAETIANMERLNEIVEGFQGDNGGGNEKEGEEEPQVIQLSYPCEKIVYEEYELIEYDPAAEPSTSKRKLEDDPATTSDDEEEEEAPVSSSEAAFKVRQAVP